MTQYGNGIVAVRPRKCGHCSKLKRVYLKGCAVIFQEYDEFRILNKTNFNYGNICLDCFADKMQDNLDLGELCNKK